MAGDRVSHLGAGPASDRGVARFGGAHSEEAFLFLKGVTPIRARAVHVDFSQTTFANGAELALLRMTGPRRRLRGLKPATPAPATSAPANAQPIGAQIRKALTRAPPPASKTKAKNP